MAQCKHKISISWLSKESTYQDLKKPPNPGPQEPQLTRNPGPPGGTRPHPPAGPPEPGPPGPADPSCKAKLLLNKILNCCCIVTYNLTTKPQRTNRYLCCSSRFRRIYTGTVRTGGRDVHVVQYLSHWSTFQLLFSPYWCITRIF
jgi:hypothetical protein